MGVDLLIKNGMVLTMDPEFKIHDKADVEITGSTIKNITQNSSETTSKVIDAAGKLVMPGLINCHTHAAMVMMRGLADDMPLDVWWKKFIFPIEKQLLDPDFVRIGMGLAAIEMIRSGTTCFSDMYFFQEAAAEVCKKIGIRAVLGEAIMDEISPDAQNADKVLEITERLQQTWAKDDLISIQVAPHTPYSCGPANLKKAQAQAKRLGIPLHIHVSETATEVNEFRQKHGKSPVKYLEELGFLGENVIAVHCVHLDDQDKEILAKYKVKVAHCQESNMKLASGNAPIVELQNLGVMVGLGTDGAASNNNLDLFDEMDSVAKYHKAVRQDPTAMPATTVLRMATIDGARTLMKEKEIGSLEAGKKADIIILDLNKAHLIPLYNIYSQLVYAAGGSEVETVIINGQLIMENKNILTVDEQAILDVAKHLGGRIKNELKI